MQGIEGQRMRALQFGDQTQGLDGIPIAQHRFDPARQPGQLRQGQVAGLPAQPVGQWRAAVRSPLRIVSASLPGAVSGVDR
jgi:hypothetical protein